MKTLENLKYPIGKFEIPASFNKESIEQWISTIREFPQKIQNEITSLSEAELEQQYRPEGWTIRQVVHHCADSHMNSFIRFKLALTEDVPTIKPYEENIWAELEDSKNLDVNISVNLLFALHQRWVVLLNSFVEKDWEKKFRHPETNQLIDLKTNLAIYAWHCNHHLAHIQQAKKVNVSLRNIL